MQSATQTAVKKSNTRDEIEKITLEREARRKKMAEEKTKKHERLKQNEIDGINVDVDF